VINRRAGCVLQYLYNVLSEQISGCCFKSSQHPAPAKFTPQPDCGWIWQQALKLRQFNVDSIAGLCSRAIPRQVVHHSKKIKLLFVYLQQ